ncbi:MAG: DUF1015 family protein [Acidimicrobiia bacterium]|nr:DUF1015 family protein [Acidimicrobiia bacterium]
MTELLRPFSGYIPESSFGPRVVGPPSATLTTEQKAEASADPWSFRFTAGRKAGCSQKEAMEWLENAVHDRVLLPIGPAVVVYRQERDEFTATGILCDLSLAAYRSGRVKRHEKTITKTQNKMARYMRTTRVYGNPPVTAIPRNQALAEAMAGHASRDPDSSFATVDGIAHDLWVVGGRDATELCEFIDSDLYITDGHHRLAAASLVADEEGSADARIPVGVFSGDEFRLEAFARCVFDSELDVDHAIEAIRSELVLEEVTSEQAAPRSRHEFGARIGNRYFRMSMPPDRIPGDHHSSLNTNLLQELVLAPVFGIDKPRQDKRLKFAPDLGRGREACPDADAWFLPFPLEVTDVVRVADAGQAMPPKSTRFVPKLPSGLVIRPIG